MKTVKIKVKHILVIAAIILAAFILRPYVIPGLMYSYANILSAAGNKDKADALYNKLGTEFPTSSLSADALFKRCAAQFLGDGDVLNFSNIYSSLSSFGMSEYGKIIKADDLEKLNGNFAAISKSARQDSSFDRLEMAVSLMNWFGGNTDYAFELMQKANKTGDKLMHQETSLYLAIMNVQTGEFDKSKAILSALVTDDSEIKNYVNYIKWNLDVLEGKWTPKPEVPYYSRRKTLVSLSSIIKGMEYSVQNHTAKSTDSGVISGVITVSGKPVKGMIVGLNRVNIIEDGGIGGDTEIEYLTTTASDGSYQLDKLAPGRYFVDIKAPWFRIKDTQIVYKGLMADNREVRVENGTSVKVDIKFNPAFKAEVSKQNNGILDISWSAYPEAAYYRVQSGPMQTGNKNMRDFFNATFSKTTEETNYKLDIDKYADIPMPGYGYSSMGGDESSKLYIEPSCIIGAFYQPGNYAISVIACDKDGNTLATSQASSSGNNVLTVSLDGRQYSQADKLLFEKKYEEAIAQYRKQIEQNPRDAHSMRMLGALYSIGYANDGTGKDLNKALSYYKQLNNIAPSQHSRMQLGNLYLETGDTSQAIRVYNEIVQYDDEYKEDTWYRLFNAYAFDGQFNNAITAQHKAVQTGIYSYNSQIISLIQILQGSKQGFDSLVNDPYLTDGTKKQLQDTIEAIPAGKFEEFHKLLKADRREAAFKWLSSSETSNWNLFYKGLLTMTLPTKLEATINLDDIMQQLRTSKNGQKQADALMVLGRQLRGLIKEDYEKVSTEQRVSYYLSKLGDKSYTGKYGDGYTWYTAAEKLGAMGKPAIPGLIARLDTKDDYERALAFYALLLATQQDNVRSFTNGEYINANLDFNVANHPQMKKKALEWWNKYRLQFNE